MGPSMPKQRRKPKKQKESISFPNILGHVEEPDAPSRNELASIAGSALRLGLLTGANERILENDSQNGKVIVIIQIHNNC